MPDSFLEMSRAELLAELTAYVGFDADDVALIVAARPRLESSFPEIIDAFYVAIEAQPRARAIFVDGAQIERQKAMLGRWLEGVFAGVYDAAYLESRARVGRAHVRIGLDPALMVAAMNVVRRGLHGAVREHVAGPDWPRGRIDRLHDAIDRICDVDSAIMLETYRDDFAVRIRGTEKLAALGRIAGTIGHELRNPLAVMETSIHLLTPRVPDDPKARKHLDRLSAQVVLCTNIVRDLMDLARDREPSREPTTLGSIVADALAGIPSGELVRVVVEPPELLASVDPVQFRQLVVNLVSNAIQAANSGGQGVTLALRTEAHELLLVVEDDGPGIPEDAWPRLFEPLFTTRVRGVGFGLALCRMIAERHGGQIRASNLPGSGARFEVRIPIRRPGRA